MIKGPVAVVPSRQAGRHSGRPFFVGPSFLSFVLWGRPRDDVTGLPGGGDLVVVVGSGGVQSHASPRSRGQVQVGGTRVVLFLAVEPLASPSATWSLNPECPC